MRFLLFLLLFGAAPSQNDIAALGNPGFEVREAASERLEKMQAAAIPILEYEMWHNKDPEVTFRCRMIVEHYYSFESVGECELTLGRCEIPITHMSLNDGIQKYYLKKAHKLLKGDTNSNSMYLAYHLPNKAGQMYIQDQIYWGTPKENLQSMLNKGATRLLKNGPVGMTEIYKMLHED
jgi:hypothetical protein